MYFIVIGKSSLFRFKFGVALGVMSSFFWIGYMVVGEYAYLNTVHGLIGDFARSRVYDMLLIRHGIYFSAGILIQSKQRPWWLALVGLLMVIAAVLEIRFEWNDRTSMTNAGAGWAYPCIIFTVAMMFMVVSIRYNDFIHSFLPKRALDSCRFIGLITYPLYLMHVVTAFASAYLLIALGISPLAAWIDGFIAAIVAAVVVAKSAEPTARNLVAHVYDSTFGKF